jgi:hypothetical protein
MGRPATDDRVTDVGAITILGLCAGERVRFRRKVTGRWSEGKVTHREADGTVAVTDERGRCYGIPVEQIEVRCAGPRGGRAWEPLESRASRSEQLRLL